MSSRAIGSIRARVRPKSSVGFVRKIAGDQTRSRSGVWTRISVFANWATFKHRTDSARMADPFRDRSAHKNWVRSRTAIQSASILRQDTPPSIRFRDRRRVAGQTLAPCPLGRCIQQVRSNVVLRPVEHQNRLETGSSHVQRKRFDVPRSLPTMNSVYFPPPLPPHSRVFSPFALQLLSRGGESMRQFSHRTQTFGGTIN